MHAISTFVNSDKAPRVLNLGLDKKLCSSEFADNDEIFRDVSLPFSQLIPVFRIGKYREKFHGVNLTFSQKDACF